MEGIHYKQFLEQDIALIAQHHFFAGNEVFGVQKGVFETFEQFTSRYLQKFQKSTKEDPRDFVDILYNLPVFEQLEQDLSEPTALNVLLQHEDTRLNLWSQGTKSMSKSNSRDLLHCVVAG